VVRFQLEIKTVNTVLLIFNIIEYYLYLLVFINNKNNYNGLKCFDLNLLHSESMLSLT